MKFLFSTFLFLTSVLSLPHGEAPAATTSALFSVVAPSPISNATTSALFSVVGTPSASSVPSSAVKAAPSHQVNDHEHDYNDDDRKNNPPLPSTMDVKPTGSNASKPLNTTTSSGKPITPPSPSGKPTPSALPQPQPQLQQPPPQQKPGATAPYLNATLTSAFDNNGYSESEDDNKGLAGYSKEGGEGDKTVSPPAGTGAAVSKPVNGTQTAGVKDAGAKDAGVKDAGVKDAGKVGKGKSTADLIPDSRVEA